MRAALHVFPEQPMKKECEGNTWETDTGWHPVALNLEFLCAGVANGPTLELEIHFNIVPKKILIFGAGFPNRGAEIIKEQR